MSQFQPQDPQDKSVYLGDDAMIWGMRSNTFKPADASVAVAKLHSFGRNHCAYRDVGVKQRQQSGGGRTR